MPRAFPRSRRIAEQIRRELAEIIRLELKDPRANVGLLTLTDVEMTSDNAHAKVFFTLLGNDEAGADEANAMMEAALTHAAGFLRRALAHRMKLRIVPTLHFAYDTSVQRGMRLSRLIDDAVAADSARHDK